MSTAIEDRMRAAVATACELARPRISGYAVGAVAQGASGALYLGANQEYPGVALDQTVHAEQAAVARAWQAGETGVPRLAVSAPPCGHCRQFLNELTGAGDLRILLPGGATATLRDSLPDAFGPANLGRSAGWLAPVHHELVPDREPVEPAAQAALDAAARSYAPYTGTLAGAAIGSRRGVFAGSYAENAAFNPSLLPLQCADIARVAAGVGEADIETIVLAQAEAVSADLRAATRALAAALAPGIEVAVLTFTAGRDTRGHGPA